MATEAQRAQWRKTQARRRRRLRADRVPVHTSVSAKFIAALIDRELLSEAAALDPDLLEEALQIVHREWLKKNVIR
jgi:hypothetical protein